MCDADEEITVNHLNNVRVTSTGADAYVDRINLDRAARIRMEVADLA